MPKRIHTAGDVAKEGLARLRAIADPQKAAQVQKYFKESVRSFGVSSPEVRTVAKDLFQQIKKDWTCADAVTLCDLLFPRPELEAKAIAALILARYKRDFPKALFGKVKSWLVRNYLDNWASVDIFCPEVMGTLLARYPDLVDQIKDWTCHPNRWVKRASIVSFLKLAKKEEHRVTIYEICRSHFPVTDDLIQKANGWLLREVGKRDTARLEQFLLTHGPAIPRTTLRYAIERFAESKRRELLQRTKS